MAGKSTISITFKLNSDGKSFKDLAKDAEGFKKVITSTVTEAQQLNTRVINFAAMATGINAARDSLVQLQGVLQGLGDAYAVQEGAEKRLETVMRQRMQATAADVQYIKDLASAQQNLGVIGDEVQLSGAQQLSTFLHQRKSLEVLIPAMNDLIAQQKGLEATTQDAVNVGNMMGKVFTGQIGALTRVGITFTEAEGKVLKYGNEEEKAAMLAQVITNNVGHMNAELAKTDSGKLQQTVNVLGDYKEQLGGMIKGVLPFLTIASQASIALGGIVTLIGGFKSLKSALTITSIKSKAAAMGMGMLGLKASRSAAIVRVFSGAMHSAALRATALKIALRGLMIATGIGAAIVAVTAIIEALGNSSDEAAEKQRKLAEEMAEAKKEMHDISKGTAENSQKEITALDRLYKIASDESAARNKRTEAMRELIRQYPAYFSNINAEKINITDLTTQYNLLRDSIIKVARAKAAQAKIEANEGERIAIEEQQRKLAKDKQRLLKEYTEAKASEAKAKATLDKFYADNPMAKNNPELLIGENVYEPWQTAHQRTKKALQELNAVIDDRNKLQHTYYELGEANKSLAEIAGDVPVKPAAASGTGAAAGALKPAAGIKTGEDNGPKWTENAKTLKEITDNIAILNTELLTADKERAAVINRQRAELEKEADAIRTIGLSVEDNGPKWTENAKTLKEINDNTEILNQQLLTADMEQAAVINQQLAGLQKKAEGIRKVGLAAEETKESVLDAMGGSWGAVRQIGNGVESLTSALRGNANAWQILCGIVDSFLNICNGIQAVAQMIDLMTGATEKNTTAEIANTAAKTTAAATDTTTTGIQVSNSAAKATASGVEASADMTAATAKVFKAHSWIPFVGVAMAAAMVATMIATLSKAKGSVPKFADGGIAYGPTMGLFGEYPGANNNPEVVAPLDKLRGMLRMPGGDGISHVEFEIKGRVLKGILERENAIIRRG